MHKNPAGLITILKEAGGTFLPAFFCYNKIMKVLLINGSPKGKNSNSLKLAKSFIDGVKKAAEEDGSKLELDELELASLNIGPCKGCFACWKATPGKCVIKDDMQMVIEKQISADLIVWSFPLYYFNVPGLLKNLIDRQLPMSLPFMSERSDGYGKGTHEARYNTKNIRHVLVSTCGFYTAEDNYDSVRNMFNHFLGKDNFESIFCGQGELFKIKELSSRTDVYLNSVKKAGYEYAQNGISQATREELKVLLYEKEEFERMADASWGVDKASGQKIPEDEVFTKQMAALYNKNSYKGKDRILEMVYTDLGKTYQILLGKDGSKVFTSPEYEATTRIETSFELWQKISRNEISGEEALAKQLYKVTGDFDLMMNWGKVFGKDNSQSQKPAADSNPSSSGKLLPPSMAAMLIPWISFWISVSINSKTGSLISLLLCALIPLLMRKHRLIIWDQLSLVCVAALSFTANLTGNGHLPTNAGYLVFGLFWLISCLTKEPLSAAYMKYNYGGDSALKNPLFMKPNYILSVCWGVLYLLTAVWTYFLGRAGFGIVIPIINNLVPVLMGLFTAWFSKWYPAWKARGGKS